MTDDPGIRLASESDVTAIHEVIAEAYAKYLDRMDRPPAPMTRDYTDLVVAGTTWVVGEPITGVITLHNTDDGLLIENVAVRTATQGSGIGRRLLEFAEDVARDRGISLLSLYTNEVMTENLAIYAHLGYAQTDRRTEGGYHRVFMQKRLGPR
jgi:N-acetylglutamate synthase-like GNAT family acetyltransferase